MSKYRVACGFAVAVWCAGFGFGVRELYAYSTTEGEPAPVHGAWPDGTALVRSPETFTVVMFVHGECPCSRASLTELATLGGHRLIVFAGSPEGATWDAAQRILGAQVVQDPDGREAARFGARTSGATLVYDRTGTLRFSGGITGSRGHVGDNIGRRAVEQLLAGDAALATHPVFGCALGDR